MATLLGLICSLNLLELPDQSPSATRWVRADYKAAPVYSLTISPDSKMIAGGGRDGRIRLWEAASATLVREWPAHAGIVARLTFAPDGKTLVSAGTVEDSTIRLWEPDTGKQRQVLQGPLGGVGFLALSPDGSRLAFGSGSTVWICKSPDWKMENSLAASDPVDAVAFSPNGKLLAGAVNGASICVWDLASGKEVLTLLAHQTMLAGSQPLTFSFDSKTVATGGMTGELRLWEVSSGKEQSRWTSDQNLVVSLAFSPNGGTLASAHDGAICLWDVATKSPRGHWTVKGARTLCFSPDGRLLACGTAAGAVVLRRVDK